MKKRSDSEAVAGFTALMLRFDSLAVRIYPDRGAAGLAASAQAASILGDAIQRQGLARLLLASAPSQDELLAGLAAAEGIDWKRVEIFHLDEYVGLAAEDLASFRSYLQRTLLARVTPAVFHGIRGEANDPDAECARYSALLREAPIDLACLGVGENGHIAFNEPGATDFDDRQMVKLVALEPASREQQVHDGCFADIQSVPREAITLTCPAIMSARAIVCVVPGLRKASAVAATVRGLISPSCPASILRRHPAATLFLDEESARGTL